jgi:hypothetical protein
MHTSRVRLTIGGALFVIAFCAMLLALEQWFDGFGVLIAFFSPIIILGFVLHRLRGGGGVLGATLGGGIGCAVFGISVCLQNVLWLPGAGAGAGAGPSSSSGQLSGLETYYVVFLAVLGSGLGHMLGSFLSLVVGPGTGTPVWVVHQADGGKKAMIGYCQPTSSPDESI